MTIQIRLVGEGDLASVARLAGELGYPVDAETMQGRLSRLAALRDHAVFVACRDGAVVGWIHVSEVHHVQADTRAEIGGMVVAPAFRSAGIGKRLVEATERWATERGLCSILVRSQAAREAAHRFYLREGYARTKTSAVFTKALAQQGRQLE